MRYVSKLVLESGEAPYVINYNSQNLVSVTVHDTLKDRDDLYDCTSLYNADCYGVVIGSGIVVCHSQKEAGLYRFVDGVVTEGCKPSISLDLYDTVDLVHGLSLLNGCKKIAITSADTDIRAVGREGSVCVYQSRIDDDVKYATSLYRLLAKVCLETGINIMTYDEVCFYSDNLMYVSRIKLSLSKEADLFYTKMIIDISRGS